MTVKMRRGLSRKWCRQFCIRLDQKIAYLVIHDPAALPEKDHRNRQVESKGAQELVARSNTDKCSSSVSSGSHRNLDRKQSRRRRQPRNGRAENPAGAERRIDALVLWQQARLQREAVQTAPTRPAHHTRSRGRLSQWPSNVSCGRNKGKIGK